jgi:hypothetical protein
MRITIELTEDVENRLRAVAEVEGVTPARIVATLVSDVFGEHAAQELALLASRGEDEACDEIRERSDGTDLHAIPAAEAPQNGAEPVAYGAARNSSRRRRKTAV